MRRLLHAEGPLMPMIVVLLLPKAPVRIGSIVIDKGIDSAVIIDDINS